jgi:hypothetical protein
VQEARGQSLASRQARTTSWSQQLFRTKAMRSSICKEAPTGLFALSSRSSSQGASRLDRPRSRVETLCSLNWSDHHPFRTQATMLHPMLHIRHCTLPRFPGFRLYGLWRPVLTAAIVMAITMMSFRDLQNFISPSSRWVEGEVNGNISVKGPQNCLIHCSRCMNCLYKLLDRCVSILY